MLRVLVISLYHLTARCNYITVNVKNERSNGKEISRSLDNTSEALERVLFAPVTDHFPSSSYRVRSRSDVHPSHVRQTIPLDNRSLRLRRRSDSADVAARARVGVGVIVRSEIYRVPVARRVCERGMSLMPRTVSKWQPGSSRSLNGL